MRNEYADKVFRKFNSFKNAKEIAREYLADDREKKLAQFALAALVLAYRYEEENKDPWDERNKASKIYSFKNKKKFEEMFFRYSGLDAPITESGCCYYSKAIDYTNWRNTDWWNWIEAVQSEHPTNIQSYFRGMAGIVEEEWEIPYPGFPMI